jgi:hypothetical protein
VKAEIKWSSWRKFFNTVADQIILSRMSVFSSTSCCLHGFEVGSEILPNGHRENENNSIFDLKMQQFLTICFRDQKYYPEDYRRIFLCCTKSLSFLKNKKPYYFVN